MGHTFFAPITESACSLTPGRIRRFIELDSLFSAALIINLDSSPINEGVAASVGQHPAFSGIAGWRSKSRRTQCSRCSTR